MVPPRHRSFVQRASATPLIVWLLMPARIPQCGDMRVQGVVGRTAIDQNQFEWRVLLARAPTVIASSIVPSAFRQGITIEAETLFAPCVSRSARKQHAERTGSLNRADGWSPTCCVIIVPTLESLPVLPG